MADGALLTSSLDPVLWALGPWGGWDMPVSVVALEQRGTEVAATVVAPNFVEDWPRHSGG
ncbi:MAG: hypothetical protein VYD42_03095 [Actinomycetota bacterium]|nr:hypothetical protein [Actinomycetota bacterium]